MRMGKGEWVKGKESALLCSCLSAAAASPPLPTECLCGSFSLKFWLGVETSRQAGVGACEQLFAQRSDLWMDLSPRRT